MIVTILGLKGGSGKTTLAVALAEAAAVEHGAARLVDADPQGSASDWAAMAAEADEPLTSDIVLLPTARLAERLRHLPNPPAVTVIDTPPGDLSIAKAAISVADVALVPTRATVQDLHRAWRTIEVAEQGGVQVVAFLTQTRSGTRAPYDAYQALTEGNVTVATDPDAQRPDDGPEPLTLPLRESIAADFGRRPGALLRTIGATLLAQLEAPTPRRTR